MKIEKIKTGINGLDEVLDGGLPKGHCILLSGAPGTGKTIFGIQYLYNGAMQGDKCLYVAFNEEIKDVILQPLVLGWDLQKYVKDGSIKMICLDVRDFSIKSLMKVITSDNYDRVVIDSISAILAHPIAIEDIDVSFTLKDRLDRLAPSPLHESVATRLLVEKIITEVRKLDCTTIITAELVGNETSFSRDSVSEFLVDGVITLQYVMVGIESSRNLMVRKMRATSHSENIHPIEIKEGTGINVLMP